MNKNIYPSFWFDNNAKEAAELYTSIFPNSKITSAQEVAVNFELFGQHFVGINGGPIFKMNPSISMFVVFESAEAVDRAWNALIKDGKALMPLGTYPWAEKYGWVQDKFGLSWQLSCSKYHQFEQVITPQFLFVGEKVGKAKEAIESYVAIFPNSKIGSLTNYEPADGDKVEYLKNAQFSLSGFNFMAMDSSADHKFDFNEGISMVVECADQAEIDRCWEMLTANGGQESQCGWLKDRYGVSWQIIPAELGKLMSNPDKAGKVMQALLKMKKLDIEGLRNA